MMQAEAKSDGLIDLFAVRSILFLPASNPRAIAKAREAGADLVVLDLEDAVKREDKHAARKAAVEAGGGAWAGAGGDWGDGGGGGGGPPRNCAGGGAKGELPGVPWTKS